MPHLLFCFFKGLLNKNNNGGSKWDDGVLAPNGKIYCMPFNSESVLIIDPTKSPVGIDTDSIKGLASTPLVTTPLVIMAVGVDTGSIKGPGSAALGTAPLVTMPVGIDTDSIKGLASARPLLLVRPLREWCSGNGVVGMV